MKANKVNKICFFTFVELLVVLTIIAMLSAILVPSLIKSRKQAGMTNCMSNLRQLGIAAKLYSQEQNFYPFARRKISGTKSIYWCCGIENNSANFADSPMADYIQNPELLKCPGFSEFNSMDPAKPFTSSYAMNAEYIGGNPLPGNNVDEILSGPPAKPEEIKSPVLTVIFADSAKISSGISENYLLWARYSYAYGLELDASSHFRHEKRTIAVFCDGHSEDNLKPDAIFDEEKKIGWLPRENMERR